MSNRRFRTLVDNEVQSSLLFRLLAHWVLFMLANAAAVIIWVRLIELPTEAWQEVMSVAAQRLIPFILISVSLVPIFILNSLKVSNRFAGPFVRIRRVIALMAEGKTPEKIEFRQGDFWKSVAHDLNRVASQRQLNAPESSANA